MCGILGVCQLDGAAVSKDLLRRMADVIAYRGPDGQGHWTEKGVGFGHRRLAIIDLSDAGLQPMSDPSGQFTLVFNGEIYNFRELRSGLEAKGHRFTSQTDSEVILHAYKEWGAACVKRFNGMFAFAIWDKNKRTLFLARDRFGVKPLYWYFSHGRFLFASEIKAILKHPAVSKKVSLPALDEYFTFQNVLSDRTLFEGVRLLPAGCTLTLSQKVGAEPRIERYWDYRFNADESLTQKQCEDGVHDRFVNAVKRQLVSDVPVGAYLSGGMDSGSVVAVARRHLGRLTTFTGGFDLSSASGMELGFDERADSEFLSNLLKTEHYEMVMHAGDMEHILPKLIWHLEDLRVGQSYPNFYVAQLASKFVKVTLSGAGGDELFGGYPWRYKAGFGSNNREQFLGTYYDFWQRLVRDEDKSALFKPSVRAGLKGHSTFDVFKNVFGPDLPFKKKTDYFDASLYFELKTFLQGLLIVEDKLSMAQSLETRVPFLDNDLVDFSLKIPGRFKVKGLPKQLRIDENVASKRQRDELKTNVGKFVLRRAMQRLIPQNVINRTKQGFSAPDASWFRGESIDYINRLLRDPKAMLYEYVEPRFVRDRLDEHTAGRFNHRLLIWSLISFEWWIQNFFGEGPRFQE